MKNFISSWQVEDTFFGAILGAILGVFINNLPVYYVALIIFYFIIFPTTLRKANIISPYALTAAIIIHIMWISLLVYNLNLQSIIPIEKGLIFVVIFLGWILSLVLKGIGRAK